MDLSTLFYIILIVGWFLFSIFKNMKNEEKERQAMKNRPRTVVVDENDNPVQPKPKKKKKRLFNSVSEENKEEYFTYETMSERDFENEFKQHEESENEVRQAQPTTPNIQISMEEEEIYKGVVWSEILKRKY